jgi:hypothetical protein
MEAGVQTFHDTIGLNIKASVFEPSRNILQSVMGSAILSQQRELVKPKSWKIESKCICLGEEARGTSSSPYG